MNDICPSREMASPHIYENGMCKLCYAPLAESFFDADDHFPKDCPMCNHENGPMGSLGKTLHFCCRMCGWWYN